MTYETYSNEGNNYPSQETFELPDESQTAELPPVYSNEGRNYPSDVQQPEYQGTSAQPAISQIPRSTSGLTFSGILGAVEGTARTFLEFYKTANNVSTSALTEKARREISLAQIDLAKFQTRGAIDIAKNQQIAEGKISTIKAENQIAKEAQVLQKTNGTYTTKKDDYLMFALRGVCS